MPICVKSEIKPLKKVLLHRPGRELEQLSPSTMEDLLFDDIPYLHAAQEEHDRFADLLRTNGVEVMYLEDLVSQALSRYSDLKSLFIDDVISRAGNNAYGYSDALFEYMMGIKDLKELVVKAMSGVSYSDVFPNGGSRLSELVLSPSRFLIPPMPNLYFTRDPFACIGKGVSINKMHTSTRNRETVFGKYIFRYHPEYSVKVPIYYSDNEYFSIEGGDILNLSANVLCLGVSERTQADAAEALAYNIFKDEEAEIDTVLALYIPHTRAFMHLDTVFTQADTDKFIVHPGILQSLRIFELSGKGKTSVTARELNEPLDVVLAKKLGLDKVELILCGGESRIAADREQWNDGANTLCIKPGTIIVYDRNYVTNQLLVDAGINVIKLGGSELSRGRGGPRCMSMPFFREQ
ncbi:MAG: arginine deiminase [Ruminococcaceae bacterium]|nr:arginine deiminase [Oscillospiraceae bacterium]